MIHQFFKQEMETVNITYHKIYILNLYANSSYSGIRILCTQQEQKPQSNILNIFMTINLKFSSEVQVTNYLPRVQKSLICLVPETECEKYELPFLYGCRNILYRSKYPSSLKARWALWKDNEQTRYLILVCRLQRRVEQ